MTGRYARRPVFTMPEAPDRSAIRSRIKLAFGFFGLRKCHAETSVRLYSSAQPTPLWMLRLYNEWFYCDRKEGE